MLGRAIFGTAADLSVVAADIVPWPPIFNFAGVVISDKVSPQWEAGGPTNL